MPLPGQSHKYYEGLIKYDRAQMAPRLCALPVSVQRRLRRELVESWGRTFTPPSFPAGWSVGKWHRSSIVAVGVRVGDA